MFNLGYIELEIGGLNLEKLLNILREKKISIKCVERKEFNKFCIKIPYSNYKKLLEETAKLCYNISVKKIIGFASFLNFLKTRFALVLSIMCFTILLFVSNMFLLQFEVNGNKEIPTEQVCKVLNENNICFFTNKSKIDLTYVQNILLDSFDEFSMVSCSIVGNTLFINIKEGIVVDDGVKDFIYE